MKRQVLRRGHQAKEREILQVLARPFGKPSQPAIVEDSSLPDDASGSAHVLSSRYSYEAYIDQRQTQA